MLENPDAPPDELDPMPEVSFADVEDDEKLMGGPMV